MSTLSEITDALQTLVNSQRQNKRLLRLSFPKGDGPAGALLVANRLEANEGLSRDFHYTLEILSNRPDLELKELMGKMVTIELVRDDGKLRYFNGHVFDFRFIKHDAGFAYYDMVLLPWLAFLRYRRDNYLFHGKSVEQQTRHILDQYPMQDWQIRHLGPDEAMTDACQYDETHYNYLHRRWEAKGWHYWYEHRKDGHTLILCGDSTKSDPIDGGGRITWQGTSGVNDCGIWNLAAIRTIASTQYAAASFDFKSPQPRTAEIPTQNRQGQLPGLEIYEYAGAYGYKNQSDGQDFVRLRMEEIEAAAKYFDASGDDDHIQCGRSFTLAGHLGLKDVGSEEGDNEYLITEAKHRASNNYETQRGGSAEYHSTFTCLRKKIPWRPGRGHNSAEPKIYGLQTAIVVGPAGEEIHTDEYGRVRVQFHWDREGQYNEQSSAWIRVASTWAGSNFGFMAVPRIGQEVLVQFLDGNPDRPLITGRVYNQNNMPPWALPGNKTQTGLLSRSSQGGGYDNANAIRFEDKKGQEEVWLHAEKDQRIEVEHDESHWVGNDRTKTIDHDETNHIKHDRTETVDNDETITIHHNRTETVDNDETITIHNNRSERVDHNETISIGDNRTEDVGQNETVSIGDNQSIDIGGNQTVNIGDNRSVTIGGAKTETIALAKAETIGLAKALTIGGAYQTTVALLMNTTVGLSKSTQVGTTCTVTAGTKIELVCGSSKIVLTPEAIYLTAKDIHLKAQNTVNIDAPGDVHLNSGTAQNPPGTAANAEGGADGAE